MPAQAGIHASLVEQHTCPTDIPRSRLHGVAGHPLDPTLPDAITAM